MDEDEFKSELDMGKRGEGQMLTIIEFPILLLHITNSIYQIDRP